MVVGAAVDRSAAATYRHGMTLLHPRRIGFVSTRLAGTDGVSLEAAKWETVLERLGHTCYWFAGEVDRPADRSRVVAEAFYRHPEIEAINALVYAASREVTATADAEHPLVRRRDFFSPYVRPPHVTRRIEELKASLKAALYGFLRDFDLDLLVVENALAIPLNLPLGLALADVVAETGIPVLAHHHDFAWERQRFAANSVDDLIAAAFPPPLPSIRHVVINSVQARQLASRTGLTSRVIPNVMDFDSPPPPLDDWAAAARDDLGVGPRRRADPPADPDRPAEGDRARDRADPAPPACRPRWSSPMPAATRATSTSSGSGSTRSSSASTCASRPSR